MCYQCAIEQMGEDVEEEDLESDAWDDVLPEDEDIELLTKKQMVK